MNIFRRRGARAAQAAVEPPVPADAAVDMDMGVDEGVDMDVAEAVEAPHAAGGPVPLVLMTREQVERMNTGGGPAHAAGTVIRVRPGRGAYGGTVSSGGGCGAPGSPS